MVDEQKQNQGDNAAHNKSGLKGYMDYNIGLISQENLKSTANNEDVYEATKDPSNPDVYTVESDAVFKIAPQLKAGESELEKYPEMDRFAKEHAVEPSSTVVGQKSSGLPKVAKTDSPSD